MNFSTKILTFLDVAIRVGKKKITTTTTTTQQEQEVYDTFQVFQFFPQFRLKIKEIICAHVMVIVIKREIMQI